MSTIKKKLTTIGIILIFLVGLTIMFYPTISNWYNQRVSSYVVATYQETVEHIDTEDYEKLFAEARAYNATVDGTRLGFVNGAPEEEVYMNALDLVGGVMGYIEIDSINVNLPIYHGTEESVLQKGVGHLEGSSLPIGDVDSHAVLTGHSGLPSAELFTKIDQLEIGDTFEILILNEDFTYQVDDIHVVEPDEVNNLKIQEGKDMVTLVTCTPYGVNSHRLLVQGTRIATPVMKGIVQEVAPKEMEPKEAVPEETIDVMQYLPFALCALVALLVIACIIGGIKRKKNKIKQKKELEFAEKQARLHHMSERQATLKMCMEKVEKQENERIGGNLTKEEKAYKLEKIRIREASRRQEKMRLESEMLAGEDGFLRKYQNEEMAKRSRRTQRSKQVGRESGV